MKVILYLIASTVRFYKILDLIFFLFSLKTYFMKADNNETAPEI